VQTTLDQEREYRHAQPGEGYLGVEGPSQGGEENLAKALGWFSIGLGVAEILAPDQLARFIGVEESPTLLRIMGLREIASGVGILAQERPAGWMWSRVAGDAIDLALLGVALTSERSDRSRVLGATAAVAGVTALDLVVSRQLSGDGGPVRVRKAITIYRSPQEVYSFWRDFQNLPRFMRHLESVRVLDGKRSHWVAKGPAGSHFEWEAEITEDRPGEIISWRSLEGADIDHFGSVRFGEAPRHDGTEIHVELSYFPPGGSLGSLVASLFGREPGQEVQSDLRRLKQIMETGEIPTTAGQPSGPSRTALVSRLVRSAERHS
jgi:uncharacterized membrane protein